MSKGAILSNIWFRALPYLGYDFLDLKVSKGNQVKFNFRSMALALAIVLVGAYIPVVAYPPGTPVSATLTPDLIVAKKGKTKLSINNAKPNAVTTIVVGKKSSDATTETGAITKTLTGLASGIYTITVTTPSNPKLPDEVASVKLYVPSVTAPKTGKISAKTLVKLKFLKPGTVLTLTPKAGKKTKKKITVKVKPKANIATITIPAKTFIKGKNNTFVLTIGKIKTTYKFTGK